jgi:hypothetical protein
LATVLDLLALAVLANGIYCGARGPGSRSRSSLVGLLVNLVLIGFFAWQSLA